MDKLAYALVNEGDAPYADMAYISMRLARTLHPGIAIALVSDSDTWEAMQTSGHPVLNLISEAMPVDVPVEGAAARSRYLKIAMRKHIRGDYLFLDVDAFPVRPFGNLGIRQRHAVFAAASDGPSGAVPEPIEGVCKKLGWPVLNPPYINSGVTYWSDTHAAHKLSERWLARWQEFREEGGRHVDQPALNCALADTGVPRVTLAPAFNAQIAREHKAMKGAKVLHFFSSWGDAWEASIFSEMVREVRKHGELSESAIDAIIRNPYPWKTPGSIRGHWHAGQYMKAVTAMFRRVSRPGLQA